MIIENETPNSVPKPTKFESNGGSVYTDIENEIWHDGIEAGTVK